MKALGTQNLHMMNREGWLVSQRGPGFCAWELQ